MPGPSSRQARATSRQHVQERRPAPGCGRREVGAAVERLERRRQPHAHRPAAAAGGGLHEGHVDAVDVGPLLAIDLDADELAVQHLRGGRVVERLVRHDVAPVAGGVADRQEDRHARGRAPPRTPPRPRDTSRPDWRRAAPGTGSLRAPVGSWSRSYAARADGCGTLPRRSVGDGPAAGTTGRDSGRAGLRPRRSRGGALGARRRRRHRAPGRTDPGTHLLEPRRPVGGCRSCGQRRARRRHRRGDDSRRLCRRSHPAAPRDGRSGPRRGRGWQAGGGASTTGRRC